MYFESWGFGREAESWEVEGEVVLEVEPEVGLEVEPEAEQEAGLKVKIDIGLAGKEAGSDQPKAETWASWKGDR